MAALSVQRTGDGKEHRQTQGFTRRRHSPPESRIACHAANHGNGFRPGVLGGTHRLAHKRIDNGLPESSPECHSVRFPQCGTSGGGQKESSPKNRSPSASLTSRRWDRTAALTPLKLKSRLSRPCMGARKMNGVGITLSSQAVDDRTPRIAQAEHLGHLVEALARGVVACFFPIPGSIPSAGRCRGPNVPRRPPRQQKETAPPGSRGKGR